MILAAALLVIQSPAYTVQTIFNGDTLGTECIQVNDQSQVLAALNRETGNTPVKGYIWSKGQLTELTPPVAPAPDQYVGVLPLTFNNDGTVVADVQFTAPDPKESTDYMYQWTRPQTMQKILANGHDVDVNGGTINNNGDIALTAAYSDNSEKPWTFGVVNSLSAFAPMFEIAWGEDAALDLNDKDEIVGIHSDLRQETGYGFRILPGTSQREALALPPHVDDPGQPWKNMTGCPRAVNNGGWAVGWVFMKGHDPNAGVQDRVAALWSPDNVFYSIGAGYKAYDINDQGEVVGAQIGQVNGMHTFMDVHAFVYDSTHGIRFLDSMVPYGTPTLTSAISINNKGEILCQGTGSDWYLLTPVS